MAGDKLTKKDFASDDIFKIGSEYATSLQPAIDATENWLKVTEEAALKLGNIAEVSKLITSLKELNEVKEKAVVITKNESDANEQALSKIKALEKANKAEIKHQQDKFNRLQKESKAREAQVNKESALRERLAAQRKKEEAQDARAAVQAQKNASRYVKFSKILQGLRNEYRDLALKKELGIKLSIKEEARLGSLTKRVQMLDKAYKKVDAQMGIHNRNVGDYKRSFDSLGFSVAQLTRESPAFINSIQTGFMALSNNIPIFVDEINKLTAANKGLAASGKPTVNVFKKVGKAVFSWQSLISFGIVILTLYGAKLVEWVSSMVKGADATSAAAKAQKEWNEVQKEGVKTAQKSITELKLLNKAVQDTSKSEKERNEILATLREKYGEDISHLTDKEILINGLGDAEEKLAKNILASAKAEAARQKLIENEGELIDLRETEGEQLKKFTDAQKLLNDLQERGGAYATQYGVASDGTRDAISELSDAQKELAKTQHKINILTETNNVLTGESIKNLDSLISKSGKGTSPKERKGVKDNSDSDVFSLKKAQLQRELRINQDKLINEKSSLTEKLNANEIYIEKASELAILEKDNAIRIAQEKYDEIKNIDKVSEDEILAAKKSFDAKVEITEIKHQEKIASISKKQSGNQEKIFSDRFKQLLEEVKAEKALKEQAKNTELADLDARLEIEMNLVKDNDAEKLRLLEEYENKKKAIKSDFAKQEIDAQIAKIKTLMQTEGLGTEETKALQETLNALRLAGYEIDVDNYEKAAKDKADAEKRFNDFVTDQVQFAAGIISDVWDINGQVLEDFFTRMTDFAINGIESIEDVLAAMVVTAQLVREVGNAVFDERIDRIDEEIDASNEKYDAEIEGLDLLSDKENETEVEKLAREKKERALEAQKRKEEEKLEKEKRKLQTKQAEFNKAIAINTALINVALGITSALATAPPASFVMAALVGALGAVQVAAIAAKPIPKYRTGKKKSDNYSGFALLNDGGKTEYQETPDGSIHQIQGRNVVGHVGKDDIIHKDYNAMVDYHSNDDLIKQAYAASMLTSLQIDKNELSKRQAEERFVQNMNNEQLKKDITDSIKGIQVHNHINNEGLAEAIADELDDRNYWNAMN